MAAACLLLGAACSGEDEGEARDAAAGSPPPTGSDTAAGQALAAAVEQFRQDPHSTFTLRQSFADGLLLEVKGSAHPSGYESIARVWDIDDLEGAPSVMRTRSVLNRHWMQMADWTNRMRGCWLELPPTQAPLGVQGLSIAEPGYISLAGVLRAQDFRNREREILGGGVALRYATALLNVQAVAVLGLGESMAADQTYLTDTFVPATIRLRAGRLLGWDLHGAGLIAALEEVDVLVPEEVRALLGGTTFVVRYSPTEAMTMAAPKPALITTADEAGCR